MPDVPIDTISFDPISSVDIESNSDPEVSWEAITPVPEGLSLNKDSVPLPPRAKSSDFIVDFITPYKNAQGELLFYVVRYEKKDFRPVSWCTHPKWGTKWWWKFPKGLKPLCRLDKLNEEPDKPVVVVEGEKTLLAAMSFYPEAICTTWPGGTGNIEYIDWEPLSGREVLVIADADNHGRKATERIAAHLNGKAKSLRLSLPPGEDGKDLADFDDEAEARQWVKDNERGQLIPFPEKPEEFELPLKDRVKLIKDQRGLEKALELLDIKVRYNLRRSMHEYLFSENERWLPSNDRLESNLRHKMELNFATEGKIPKKYWFSATEFRDRMNGILNSRECDPFVNFLDDLPEWDGVERLSNWLEDIFEVENAKLAEWGGRYLFLAAVCRAYEPGCKIDEFPVVVGEQGIGKSAVCRSILPPEEKDWFGDALNLDDSLKEQSETLQGRVVMEIQEMAGLRRADIAKVKGFISRQDDGQVRHAYRANPETQLRRCIIVGTSDDLDSPLPNDPAGMRRFVPIILLESHCAVESYLDANREQLWAEAVELYRQGETPKLKGETKHEALKQANLYRRKDPLEERFKTKIIDKEIPVSTEDAAEKLGIDNLQDDLRMNARLRNLFRLFRWRSVQVRLMGGGKEYRWHPQEKRNLPLGE